MGLPIFNDTNRPFQMMQTQWAGQLNPVLANPSLKSIILKSVPLLMGSNTINHMLGRQLQGWRIIRQRAASSIYDNQDNNPQPDLTLLLIASADAVVDLEVF